MIRASGDFPQWSPPGVPEKIAFNDGWFVLAADPDGMDVTTVYSFEVGWAAQGHRAAPYWSPDGEYIAFLNVVLKMGKGGVGYYNDEIRIVGAQGGSTWNLTGDLPQYSNKEPLGWRGQRPQ